MSGEVLGTLLSIICISTSSIILPSLLIWITTLNVNVLKEKKSIELFGQLYDGIRV